MISLSERNAKLRHIHETLVLIILIFSGVMLGAIGLFSLDWSVRASTGLWWIAVGLWVCLLSVERSRP